MKVENYSTAGQATDDIIRCLRFACRITEPTDTYSEYVILIDFPQQQWLCERASMLRYTYIAYLVGNDPQIDIVLRQFDHC